MKRFLLLISLISLIDGENISPFFTAQIEASGIFYLDSKQDVDVMRCIRISRPCPIDVNKSLGITADNCINEPPFTILAIESNPSACTDRRLMLQDSMFAHVLISMPNSWHNKLENSKSYYNSDSIKIKDKWKLHLKGWTSDDSIALSKWGTVRGRSGATLRIEGEKCEKCN